MDFTRSTILVLSLLAASPATAGEWRPTRTQVAELETAIRMPSGATGPLLSYERYYAGDVRQGRRVIVGELVHLAIQPVSPPVLRIVRLSQLPALADFGCGVIRFTYDVARRQLSPPECGDQGTPPPPPGRKDR